MRQIGSLTDSRLADRFAAFLVTEGVDAYTEKDDGQWAIWVRDENQLDKAKNLLNDFRDNPEDSRYDDVERAAAAIQQEQARQREMARKNLVEMRNKWGRAGGTTAKRAPLVFVLIGLSILASLWTRSLNPQALQNNNKEAALLAFSATPTPAATFSSIQKGQLWRLVTPIFVHIGIWHLVLNLYWIYRFGAQIEHFEGTFKFGLLVLAVAVLSNLAQAVVSGPNFFGISGVVCGLFGYVWVKSRYEPNSPLFVHQWTTMFLFGYLFFCLFATEYSPENFHVANTAHFAGLGVGAVLAYLPLLNDSGKAE